MASRGKLPVRLTGLHRAYAAWASMHPAPGDLPGAFVLDFRQASGPGILNDGRMLRASLTPAELADAVGAIPALSMTDNDDDLRAVMRVIRLLKGGSHGPGH